MPHGGQCLYGSEPALDARYNLQNQTSFGGDTLSYDAENRMIQAAESASNGGGVMDYFYDGLGQRVEKAIVNGSA